MESRTKNRKGRGEIEAMVKAAFGGVGLAEGEEAVVELKDGWFNASYLLRLDDGREVVLKIAPPEGAEVMAYEHNLMATEVATMRLVASTSLIPVPQIYFYDDTHILCDADYFFMEKVVGENLHTVRERLTAETLTAIDRQTGEIIREVNGFQGSYFGYDGNPALRADNWREAFVLIVESVLEDAARKDAVFDFGYDEIRAAIQKHTGALAEVTTPCLVHWDAWNPNFFVQDGRVSGIIDFERALWADPLMEAQFRRFPGMPEVTDPMRGYGKTTFSTAEQQRCHLYALHLALVMFTECFFRNYDTDDVYNLSRDYLRLNMEWLRGNDDL